MERRFRLVWRPARRPTVDARSASAVVQRRPIAGAQPTGALAAASDEDGSIAGRLFRSVIANGGTLPVGMRLRRTARCVSCLLAQTHSRFSPPSMQLIDISRSITSETAVWPGDEPVRRSWTARIEEGSSVNLSALSMSVHAGTHTDSPYHVSDEGATSDAVELEVFVGAAQVVAVDAVAIAPTHVRDLRAPRVLFKTKASSIPDTMWSDDFPPLLPDTIDALAAQDVVLAGTDAPSIDPVDSVDLDAHHALFDAGMANLENLNLHNVEPGVYRLIAFPLKLPDADAAPVRAVLIDD